MRHFTTAMSKLKFCPLPLPPAQRIHTHTHTPSFIPFSGFAKFKQYIREKPTSFLIIHEVRRMKRLKQTEKTLGQQGSIVTKHMHWQGLITKDPKYD